ncbi:hypothetical protein HDV05_008667, partial [Chytridiales sp. JEL 0842]
MNIPPTSGVPSTTGSVYKPTTTPGLNIPPSISSTTQAAPSTTNIAPPRTSSAAPLPSSPPTVPGGGAGSNSPATPPPKCVKWRKKTPTTTSAAVIPTATPPPRVPINGTPDAPAPDASKEQEGLEVIPAPLPPVAPPPPPPPAPPASPPPPPPTAPPSPPPAAPQTPTGDLAARAAALAQQNRLADLVPLVPTCDQLGIRNTRLSASLQEDTLLKHNIIRQAWGLPPLTWDPALETSATSLAALQSGCTLNHRGSGENLAASWGSGASDANFVCLWYDEYRDFLLGNRGPGVMTGHFTQIVWKGTSRLGCATAP